MRILSAAKLGQINRNEIRNDSNATTFTPLVSLIFRLCLQPIAPENSGSRTRLSLSSCSKSLPWARVFHFPEQIRTGKLHSIPAVYTSYLPARLRSESSSETSAGNGGRAFRELSSCRTSCGLV